LSIKCLEEKCHKSLSEEEIKNYIGEQIFKKYKKFKFEQERLGNPEKNYLFCPIVDCEEMIECDKDLNTDPFFKCSKNHKFCGKCKTPGWHTEGKCNDVK